MQESDEGVEKVVQYISHILSPTQRNYPVIENEAYAVIYSILKLRPYLYGCKFSLYIPQTSAMLIYERLR